MTARGTNGLRGTNERGPVRIGRPAANGGYRNSAGLDLSSSDVEHAKDDSQQLLEQRLINRRLPQQQNTRKHNRTSSPRGRRLDSVLAGSPPCRKAMERKTSMAPSRKNGSGGVLELVHMGLTFILWLLGLAVVILGALLLADERLRGLQSLRHFGPLQSAAVLVIVIGVLVILLGFIGCLAVNTRSRPLLLIFTFFLLCLIILEIAACALTWYYQKGTTVDSQLTALIDRVIREVHVGRAEYRDGDSDWRFNRNELSFIEYTLRCCGSRRGITDYTALGVVVPLSCYNRDYSPYNTNHNDYYNVGSPYNDVGCVNALQNFLFKHGLSLGLLSLVALLIEIVLVIISVTLAFRSSSSSDDVSSKQTKTQMSQGPLERGQRYSPVPQQRPPFFDQGLEMVDKPDPYISQTGGKQLDSRPPFHQSALSEDV